MRVPRPTSGRRLPHSVTIRRRFSISAVRCSLTPATLWPGKISRRCAEEPIGASDLTACHWLVKSCYTGYFFVFISRRFHASNPFLCTSADRDLFGGGSLFSQFAACFVVHRSARSDARWVFAEASRQWLDRGSSFGHSRADRVSTWIFAGARNRRSAEGFPAGIDAR